MMLQPLGFCAAFALLLWLPEDAQAEMDVDGVNSCLSSQGAAGQSPASCVQEAQARCLSVTAQAPAVATLCFVEVEKEWQSAVAALMQEIRTKAPEQIAQIAEVEGKYDLLSALLQCSRLEELAQIVGRENDAAIQRQNAGCKANATGLTYARLFLRSRDLR